VTSLRHLGPSLAVRRAVLRPDKPTREYLANAVERLCGDTAEEVLRLYHIRYAPGILATNTI
jgi:hypothetical protein